MFLLVLAAFVAACLFGRSPRLAAALCAVLIVVSLTGTCSAQCATTSSVSSQNLQLGQLTLPQFAPSAAASASAGGFGAVVPQTVLRVAPSSASAASVGGAAVGGADLQQLSATLSSLAATVAQLQAQANANASAAANSLALQSLVVPQLAPTAATVALGGGGSGGGGCSRSVSVSRSGGLFPLLGRRSVSRSRAVSVTRGF